MLLHEMSEVSSSLANLMARERLSLDFWMRLHFLECLVVDRKELRCFCGKWFGSD